MKEPLTIHVHFCMSSATATGYLVIFNKRCGYDTERKGPTKRPIFSSLLTTFTTRYSSLQLFHLFDSTQLLLQVMVNEPRLTHVRNDDHRRRSSRVHARHSKGEMATALAGRNPESQHVMRSRQEHPLRQTDQHPTCHYASHDVLLVAHWQGS